uniref:NADH-ubiquinone oxidoreductase chain 4 n=1 Tax=Allobaccha apicalis TaxID=2998874 RepID=A0A9E8MC85_9MUSC|nr:NADH dehydrogenase subunit 4 [Allobaccha apicalis]WAB45763.1 NADH dehydrogenase subunit 4 [Allobaccha apicalis]
MLKILFMLIMLFPFCLMKNMFWMVQNMLFFIMFILILTNYFTNYWMMISYFLGMDLLSYGMVLLSFWICSLMLMASYSVNKYQNYEKLFLLNLMVLLLMLFLTFSSMNIFMFYLFFECSLIPTLLLILGWGYQPERLQAGMYLLFYTLLVSLPMLVAIFYIYNNYNTMSFYLINNYNLNYMILYFSLILSFLVKMPMFLVHLWLPKAHVEAPVAGSMILAGIMLKLGGYGLLRFFFFLQILGLKYNYWFMSISLVGGVLVSFICLRQTDLKALIAYSSVAHMGIVLSGLMTMTYWGISGSYTLMIAHGLCSSGLFCLANITYERLGSRSLLINKGLMNFMPSMTLWWFLLCSSNMAAPPTLNLLGEITLLNSIVSWSVLTMMLLIFTCFFSAAYTLYLYAYSQHGKLYSGIYSFSMGYLREYLLLFLHWFPLNLLVLKSDMSLFWL